MSAACVRRRAKGDGTSMNEKNLNRSIQLLMIASVLLAAAGIILLTVFFLDGRNNWVLCGALFSISLANLFHIVRGQLG